MKSNDTSKFEKAMGLLKEVFEEAQNSHENRKAPQSDLIPYKDALERFSISRSTLYRWERDGLVKVHRLSRRKLYVSVSQIESVIKSH